MDNDNEQRTLVAFIVGFGILVAMIAALGSVIFAVGQGSRPAAPAAAAPAPASAQAAASAPAPAAQPALPVVAKVHFPSGATGVPAEAAAALQPVMDAARAHPAARLAISGFHDKTGNAEQNAEVAKQRAFAIRDLLVAAGIDAGRIELRKPQETMGGADDAEARRVEVSIE